jgi:hypothetical protein
VDFFISTIISGSSLALLCYWFRYSCLLILAAEAPHDYSEEVAKANQLSFREVRSKLRKDDAGDLDNLHKCLERDYAIITYLLDNATAASPESFFEDAMLKAHYRIMSTWFHLTRGLLHEDATQALAEMSKVIRHFANCLGERTLAPASVDWI